tara:strand:- start:10000 stop:10536 length:537 start_codon:yes stop_codon:yes gene_type:complete
MMKSVIALTCAALMTCGLQAQVGGSLNRNAAKVSTSITMGKNKLAVSYTAIRFGKGDWQKAKDNKDGYERFNARAAKSPVGSVTTSCDLMAAGRTIPAGTYSMFFTLHERAGWLLNLKPAEGEGIMWGMKLTDSDKSDCMKINLEPSAKDNTCAITIMFGDKSVSVPVTVKATEDKDN